MYGNGHKLNAAIDFLINHVAGIEMSVKEVEKLAQDAGISEQTLNRARRAVGARPRRSGGRWFISVPQEARERFASCAKSPGEGVSLYSGLTRSPFGVISSDWIAVVTNTDGKDRDDKIQMREEADYHFRVKIGAYEFEADVGFPTEKLVEILRELVCFRLFCAINMCLRCRYTGKSRN